MDAQGSSMWKGNEKMGFLQGRLCDRHGSGYMTERT